MFNLENINPAPDLIIPSSHIYIVANGIFATLAINSVLSYITNVPVINKLPIVDIIGKTLLASSAFITLSYFTSPPDSQVLEVLGLSSGLGAFVGSYVKHSSSPRQ